MRISLIILILLGICACEGKIEDCTYTKGVIVKSRYYKKQYYYYNYYVDGRKFTRQEACYISSLKNGEMYEVCFDNNNPELAKLILSKPVIDSSKYQITNGTIKNKYDGRKLYFTYEVSGRTYTRGQYIDNNQFEKGDNCKVLFNRSIPSVAYLDL